MKTEIIKLNRDHIDLSEISRAAEVIRRGGLVAFPTETVYGLGANALDEGAVKAIFKAKGRPSDNPLIVHISDKADLDKLVTSFPAGAESLMGKFWPGPITFVLNRSTVVPDIITAGLDTVAVRMPSHPIALALIQLSGCPIAAPSANTSGKPSPTSAKHVLDDLFGKVDMIIDGGNCEVGLESTVLDVTVSPPMILRPGGITFEQIRTAAGDAGIDPALEGKASSAVKPKSPGMKYTHYSPKAEVMVVSGSLTKVVAEIHRLAEKLSSEGKKVGVLATEQTRAVYSNAEVISMGDRDIPETIAANLFRDLREFDERGVQVILAEAIDRDGIGLAVMNRMNKAAGYNIIKVD